jgi:hypothetical protein
MWQPSKFYILATDEILDKYYNKLGISKTAIVELALREFEEKRYDKDNEKIRN